jgi:hypothetical protein
MRKDGVRVLCIRWYAGQAGGNVVHFLLREPPSLPEWECVNGVEWQVDSVGAAPGNSSFVAVISPRDFLLGFGHRPLNGHYSVEVDNREEDGRVLVPAPYASLGFQLLS